MVVRTSLTDPLEIDLIDLIETSIGGRLGLTFCPGKVDPYAMTGAWRRDLAVDLPVIVASGASALVTLMEADELHALEVPHLGDLTRAAGLAWWHLPIRDMGVPDAAFEARWQDAGPALHRRLRGGELVVLHCRGGLGRTGTIAARLLVELGEPPDEAIRRVRAARRRPEQRRSTIENALQEAYVRSLPVGGARV